MPRPSIAAALIALGLATSLCPADATAETRCDTAEPIVFAGLDWDSSRFHNAVSRFILEEGYGCRTDLIPGSTVPMLTALARGDVHLYMEVWAENNKELWEGLVAEGAVVELGINFPDAIQGFFVPRYVMEGDPARGIPPRAPDLKHVDDLKRYADLFADPEVPGKGRFYNCILGWTCETLNTHKLRIYGLDELYTNFRPGTGAALASAIAAAYARGEPILTYYWGPTWVLGKFDLVMLEEPAFDRHIWEALQGPSPTRATAYPVIAIKKGAHRAFIEKAPVVAEFIRNYRTTNAIVSDALLHLEENEGSTIDDAARAFLTARPDLWRAWVPADVAERVAAALVEAEARDDRPPIDIAGPINRFVEALVADYGAWFDLAGVPLLQLVSWSEEGLLWLPWWLFILLCVGLGHVVQPGWRLPAVIAASLGSIVALGLWPLAIQTLALMLISILVSLIIGLPLGVAMARSDRLRTGMLPLLDAMQTMPSFVYLIPALMLFGLGKVPALFATVIYAVIPLIRLTDLGIRQVDAQVREAAIAFGADRRQLLVDVQLPLALPTIMAGINQTTMMALSMVVIASMIGARGLGEQVLLGIQKLDVGQGFTAGLGIVALAIALDRTTQAIGRRLDRSA